MFTFPARAADSAMMMRRLKMALPTMVPIPTSLFTNTPERDVNNSGADDPATEKSPWWLTELIDNSKVDLFGCCAETKIDFNIEKERGTNTSALRVLAPIIVGLNQITSANSKGQFDPPKSIKNIVKIIRPGTA